MWNSIIAQEYYLDPVLEQVQTFKMLYDEVYCTSSAFELETSRVECMSRQDLTLYVTYLHGVIPPKEFRVYPDEWVHFRYIRIGS